MIQIKTTLLLDNGQMLGEDHVDMEDGAQKASTILTSLSKQFNKIELLILTSRHSMKYGLKKSQTTKRKRKKSVTQTSWWLEHIKILPC